MGDARIKVTIDEMNFYVVGNNDSGYVTDLAKELDSRIKATQNSNYKLNQVQTLVLTALNILDEKEKIKNENETVRLASEDDGQFRKTVQDLEKSKEKIKELEQDNNNLKDNISSLKGKYKSLEEDNKELRSKFDSYNQKIRELEELNKTLKEEKETLETQIYDSQKRIIDLNRELESLNEE